MTNEGRETPDWPHQASDENEITQEHRLVRSALLTLPRRGCPEGFEIRLTRRIQGHEVGGRKQAASPGWTIGWVGAGLGLATAFVLAVGVFDFQISSSSGTPTIAQGGVTVTSPVAVSGTGQTRSPAAEPGVPTDTGTDQVAQSKPLSTENDTTKKLNADRTDYDDLGQTVGTATNR